MIKLRALNEESSEESEAEEVIPLVTREAQEQTTFGQYNEALGMLKENKLSTARSLFEELLENSFLSEVTRREGNEGLGHPALVLKYSCLKNMGTILEKQGELKSALQHYLQAAELDGTDVTLWYRIGKVAISLIDYELACDAFLEGLRCSPRHWPSLDNLITILFVLNDYIPCLLYISRAFELDPDFLKGFIFRDKILKEQPSIVDDFNIYCKGYELGPVSAAYGKDVEEKLIQEALEMREKKRKLCTDVFTPKPLETIGLVRPLSAKLWISLGESLVQLHKHIESSGKLSHFCCSLDLELTKESEKETEREHKPLVEVVEIEQIANENGGHAVNDSGAPPGTVENYGLADGTGTAECDDVKSRKKRRSSLSFLEQWMWGGKRRSARVRSTVKREAEREDGGNLEEVLRRLVPQSLLPNVMKDEKRKELEAMKTSEESMDTMDLYKLFERRESTDGRSDDNHRSTVVSPSREKEELNKVIAEEGYFGTEKEFQEIEEFVTANTKQDIIDILTNYIKVLSSKWELSWPRPLVAVFLQAYQCMRKHVSHPSAFSFSEDPEWLKEDAYITLLYGELFLDMWLEKSVPATENTMYEEQIPAESIGQLVCVSVQEHLFQKDHQKFMLRLYWLKAHLFLNQGSAEVAMESLNTIVQYLEERCDDNKVEKVLVPNCKHHNIISKEVTKKLLTTLSRKQSLYEVQHLYDEQKYEELVEILQETFHYSQQLQIPLPFSKTNTDTCPDRATQLAMLMDALWQLKRYQDCFYWGEACCNEALHKYLNSEDKEQSKWSSAVEKLLSGLESCVIKAGLSVIDNMPINRLGRLVQNLTHIICHQLEAPETAVEMPIETISPWILLQQILQHQEEREKSLEEEEHGHIEGGELPGYISVLFTAHEFLGRRSWCCSSEGALLLHTMDIVVPRLKREQLCPVKDKLIQGLEQVFYCLYAHPNKKTKARYLQDHGVPQIPLSWERGMQLYQFYLPEELPEFDSYRVISITADVECLFKRIAGLIPAHCNPAHLVEKVMAYIDGTSPSLPVLGDARSQLPRSISAIYYLLADYYFKVNEWGKAIRHYLLDVCVNPIRIDSWAGMALARGSLLETKLNSCEPLKSEMDFLRQAAAAQRCFQRALDIEANHSLLWIEFGSFVYMVHSFCSRLLKQETDSLSLEMFEILEDRKEKMLDIAVKCFTSASKIWYSAGEDSGIQDERWLHQYMLGKVAEKRDHDPSVYLRHFAKACEHLHENRAVYARKISYNNPQNLAVEALEVYYRIHACILKYLEQNEGKKLDKDMKMLFMKLLKSAAEGPFMVSNSKETEGKPESDEERRKRKLESLEDVFEDVTYMKKARLDLPLDICLMEDVIDVMENIISKVEDVRKQCEIDLKTEEKPKDAVNLVPESKNSDSKDNIVEIIILDESLPRAFDSPGDATMQIDPLSIDVDNAVIKKESGREMDRNMQLINEGCPIEKLDAIDLAAEIVEGIVVEEMLVNNGSEHEENNLDKIKSSSDKEMDITKSQIFNDSKDIHENPVKPECETKCSQSVMKGGLNEGNPDGEDGDDEGEDADDDECDDADDEEEEDELKEIVKTQKVKSEEQEKAVISEQVTGMELVENIPQVAKNRRNSQESSSTTTTTTTETSTANSSSTSSDSEGDSSTSNDDSTNSSSSSDSESSDSNSDEPEQMTANKKINKTVADVKEQKEKLCKANHNEEDGIQDHYELVRCCLVALEECVLRFPQHYKSLYRLTHYYFHSKFHRNISKCQDLLLGTYKCLQQGGRSSNASFQGLFADRKSTNFFNGVWRIPVSEIDRPGSFASHMSRCVLLLMEVLREVQDHRMLLELCLQLKRTPEADKKYLRDSEREQLCHQALTLALQSLRTKLREGPVTSALVIEMYRAYQRVQRHLPQKEPTFASLLLEAYKQHTKVETVVLDQAIRFCQQEIITCRTGSNSTRITSSVSTSVTHTQPVTTVTSAGACVTTVSSQQQRNVITTKSTFISHTSHLQPAPRSRGRPPNVSRVGNATPVMSKTQSGSSRTSVTKVSSQQLGPIIPPALSATSSTLPYYTFPSIFQDPSLLTAAVQSNLSNMCDPQMLDFINRQVGGYQAEFLRHFSTGGLPSPLIPNITTTQAQKSTGTIRPSNAFQGHTNLPAPPSSSALPPSISITPLPPSQMSLPSNSSVSISTSSKYGNIKNTKSSPMPSLQQKLQASQALAKSASTRSCPLNLSSPGKSNVSIQSPPFSKASSQKSPSTTVTSSSYVNPRDQMSFSSQPSNSYPYSSLLKGGEGMLTPGVSISQITSSPMVSTTTKPTVSKLMNFRKHGLQNQDQLGTPRDALSQFKSSHNDNTKLSSSSASSKSHDTISKGRSQVCRVSSTSTIPITKDSQNLQVGSNNGGAGGSKINEHKVFGIAPAKNKNPENDSNTSGVFKNQSGTKRSRSPANSSATLRNIGHEITVTPSLSQSTSTTASTISMLSRLQQQSSDLEIFPPAKAQTLDLSVQIPSSITITPKQQGKTSPSGSDSFRTSSKKFKDTVSITEVGRKASSTNQGTKWVAGNKDKLKQEGQEEKHAEANVEIITLE